MVASLTIFALVWQPAYADTGKAMIVYQVLVPVGGVLVSLAVVFLISLFLAPYYQRNEYMKEIERLRDELNQIKIARPNIELDSSPYVDIRAILRRTEMEETGLTGATGVSTGPKGEVWTASPSTYQPYFAHAKFCNRATAYTVEAKASDVTAEISFYSDEGKLILDRIYGRWGDVEQPKEAFAPIRPFAKVEFEPTGYPHELDIAMKYKEDENCYAFNNETYFSGRDWRVPKFLLRGNKFRIKVNLKGVPMVDKEWWFMLYNEGVGKGMRIEVITTNH
jgi:hypothetical protein